MVAREDREQVLSRAGWVAFAIATIGVGLAARYGLSGWAAKYLGVALWATVVYGGVRALAPRAPARVAAPIACAISFAVELAQLTPLPQRLAAHHIVLEWIFGTTFHAWDLPSYVAGVALGFAFERAARSTLRAKSRDASPAR